VSGVLELLQASIALAEALNAIFVAPWRYLFSAKYRRARNERWAQSPLLGVVQIVLGVASIALTIAIVVYLVRFGLPQ
jgi:hypothetical protein